MSKYLRIGNLIVPRKDIISASTSVKHKFTLNGYERKPILMVKYICECIDLPNYFNALIVFGSPIGGGNIWKYIVQNVIYFNSEENCSKTAKYLNSIGEKNMEEIKID